MILQLYVNFYLFVGRFADKKRLRDLLCVCAILLGERACSRGQQASEYLKLNVRCPWPYVSLPCVELRFGVRESRGAKKVTEAKSNRN